MSPGNCSNLTRIPFRIVSVTRNNSLVKILFAIFARSVILYWEMCRMKIRKIVDVWKIIEIQSVSLFCWSVNPHQILANSNSTYAPPSEKFWNQSSRRTCFMTICIIGSHYHWIDEKNYLPMECKSIWKVRLIFWQKVFR